MSAWGTAAVVLATFVLGGCGRTGPGSRAAAPPPELAPHRVEVQSGRLPHTQAQQSEEAVRAQLESEARRMLAVSGIAMGHYSDRELTLEGVAKGTTLSLPQPVLPEPPAGLTPDQRSAFLARVRVDCFGEMVILAPEKLRYEGRPDGKGDVRIDGYEDLRLQAIGDVVIGDAVLRDGQVIVRRDGTWFVE